MQQEDDFFSNGDSSNIFKLIINKYLPFWPLFIITVGISMIVAFFQLRVAPVEYIASSRILIKDPARGSGDESTKVLEDLNIFRTRKSLDNEIVTIKSTDLIAEAVKELDLYAQVFNKGNVRTEELYGPNSPLKFIAVDKDHFNLWKTLFFDMDWDRQRIEIDGKKVPFGDTLYIDGTALLMKVNPDYNTNARGKNFYVTFSAPTSFAGSASGRMSMKPYSPSSSIIDVRLRTTVPARAKDLLSKVFEIYNKETIDDKNQAANRTIDFIDERLQLVTLQLDSVEKNIADYRTSTDVVDFSSQASNYFGIVNGFDDAIAQFDLQMDALADLQKQVRRQSNDADAAIPSLSLVNDATLSGLFNKLFDGEQELTRLKGITGPKNEAVVIAQNTVDNLRKNINDNIHDLRNNILLSKRQVQSRINENNALLRTIPEKERKFLDISRQQAVKNNIYTFLLQKKEETAIAAVATSPDLKIIDPPSSGRPVSPQPGKFYMTALIIGLLAAGALIPLKEILNKRVLFRSEVEKKIKAPVVGELMQSHDKDAFVVIGRNNRTVIAEQFRMIRTNLSFFGLDKGKNAVIVTSSVSSEGKSFVSANLAVSLTLMGHRVVLLEFDLRKPSLSKKMGMSSSLGISNYLSGYASTDEIIQNTAYDKLSFISAGPKPPNPAELISENKYPELVKELKKRFDYVIMDSAPVAPVSDTFLMADEADITLFVVRHKVTPRALLDSIENIYDNKRFKNMTVVFNGVKPRGIQILGYNVAGYGNGYGSAYGYGNDYTGKYGVGYYSEDHPNRPKWVKKILKFFKR